MGAGGLTVLISITLNRSKQETEFQIYSLLTQFSVEFGGGVGFTRSAFS
jgi:hypothetical protein